MHMKYMMMQGGTIMKHTDIKKIVLAYSGGLDTSITVSYTHLTLPTICSV